MPVRIIPHNNKHMMTTHNINSLVNFFHTYQAQFPELVDYEAQLKKILQQQSPQHSAVAY